MVLRVVTQPVQELDGLPRFSAGRAHAISKRSNPPEIRASGIRGVASSISVYLRRHT